MGTKEFVAVKVGDVIDNETESFVVGAACDENLGQWYCVTCALSFANNLQKDLHGAAGTRHVLAWACFVHGVEAP
jgi:hypothetical protein